MPAEFRRLLGYICLFFSTLSVIAFGAIDYEKIEKDLTGKGLEGWVHGAASELGQFVLTYRVPDNFFEHAEFPLVATSPAKMDLLKGLVRHDHIRVRGKFISNGAPIKHIQVEEVDLLEKFTPHEKEKDYHHEVELPKDLEGKEEMVAKVHAVANEGRVLVVEYRDVVIPIPVSKPDLTKGLYRNDKIRIKYYIKKNPGSPSHLALNPKEAEPLTVVEAVKGLHEQPAELVGELVLFPKSPQVAFNVFALHQVDKDEVAYEYTLVNFDSPEVFKQIREKLQKLWDAHPEGIYNGRNKLINAKVRIRAKGIFNVVDPGQANTQIILKDLDAVTPVE